MMENESEKDMDNGREAYVLHKGIVEDQMENANGT